MSRRQRRTKQRRQRHNAPPSKRVRAATISGSLAATAAIGLGASAGSAEAATFDATIVKNVDPSGGHGTQPVNIGGTLLFSGDDGTGHGRELWKSDGTDAGTTMIKDINTNNGGADNSNPQYLTNVGGVLFFSATDGLDNGTTQHGTELWKSVAPFDAAHTTMVADINANLQCQAPGSGDPGDSRPRGLANVGGALFFRACDGPQDATTHAIEPWTSDGATTTLVKDINTVAADHDGNSNPGAFTDVGGTAFFGATDGADNDPGTGGAQHGYELWKSTDGTPGNTTLVEDINLTGNSFPGGFLDIGGTLLFGATDATDGRELWKSTDGTAGNTTQVEDLNTAGDSTPGGLTDIGGTLFFGADDGTNGYELWKSAPPFTTETLVKNVNPTGDSNPYPLIDFGGSLLFGANDGTNGYGLWKSASPFDATNTTLVKDPDPSGAGYYPYNFTNAGGTLFFTAYDTTSGRELWSSDGTNAGTTLVKDINPGNPLAYDYGPYNLTDVNGTLFFAANDGTGYELWKTIPASPAGPAAPAPISNQFSVAGKKGNKKKGTVQYTFNLPGGGVLSEKQAGNLSAEAVASKGSVIKPASVTAAGAGPVKITIKPNKAGKSILAQKGKLRVSVKFTFTPTGGAPASQTLKVLLKLT